MKYSLKKIISYSVITILFVLLGIYLRAKIDVDKENNISITRILMGTLAEIQVSDINNELANKAINSAFNEIKRIEKIFSSYEKRSQIFQINSSNSKEIFIDEELKNLIVFSDSIWNLTGGAFDPSLGAVKNLWGFNSEKPAVPKKYEIKKALRNSGWNNFNITGNSISKKKNIQFDFGSIAKGYAVDRAIKTLQKMGIINAIVNIGGEVKVLGDSRSVGIKHPRAQNLILEKIKLKNMGVATSGDYERYFIEKGKRYNHIFDPRTGYPADLCQSVSVINKSVTIADALSTAVFVLGPEKGMNLINKLNDTECLIIDKNGERFESNGFRSYINEIKVSSEN